MLIIQQTKVENKMHVVFGSVIFDNTIEKQDMINALLCYLSHMRIVKAIELIEVPDVTYFDKSKTPVEYVVMVLGNFTENILSETFTNIKPNGSCEAHVYEVKEMQ